MLSPFCSQISKLKKPQHGNSLHIQPAGHWMFALGPRELRPLLLASRVSRVPGVALSQRSVWGLAIDVVHMLYDVILTATWSCTYQLKILANLTILFQYLILMKYVFHAKNHLQPPFLAYDFHGFMVKSQIFTAIFCRVRLSKSNCSSRIH